MYTREEKAIIDFAGSTTENESHNNITRNKAGKLLQINVAVKKREMGVCFYIVHVCFCTWIRPMRLALISKNKYFLLYYLL